MADKSTKKKSGEVIHNYAKFTWAQAFRDILLSAMDKGLLLWVIFGIYGGIILYKYPNEEIPRLVSNLLSFSWIKSVGGYVLSFVLSVIFWVVTYFMKVRYEKHIEEISSERTAWQKRALGEDKVESSEEALV